MFQIDDTVVYGSHGVCRIDDIAQRRMAGKTARYYLLSPLNNPSLTIYVPTDNPTLVGKIRRVLSPEEIHAVMQSLPRQTPIWIENDNDRKEAYREILSRGDTVELVRLVKTLFLRREALQDAGRKLHSTDETFLKEAENMLYEEFALALNIRREEAAPYFTRHLQAAQENEG